MKIKNLLFIAILFIILSVFRNWFSFNPLSTGDWIYKFPQSILNFANYPYAWNPNFGTGLGSSNVFLLALNTYFTFSTLILFKYLHLSWELIEKVVWFFPFIIISVSGSFLLFNKLFVKNNLFALISSLVFSTNSYILMVVGGGQMGIGLAYAMLPFVFLCFILILETIEKKNILISILAGIIFSIQLLFDLRIAYISMIFLGIYYLIFSYLNGFLKTIKESFLIFVFIPGLIILGLHFFWILPFIVLGENPLEKLGSAFSQSGIVKFLSFATFENTISLLHPNWPENLFGKVYFMKPEFLFLPITAFVSLLFAKKDIFFQKILIFSAIGLLGAFLAKGANEPFGTLYIWMFNHIPGFMMLRDSTKWYGIVALSYSVLIAYFLYLFSKIEIKKIKIVNLLIIVFLIFWIFTIKESFIGNLKGTFISGKVPVEYIQLTDFLSSQNQYFRTLWVPIYHQYSYYSNLHPIIAGANYYSIDDPKDLINKIGKDEKLLRESAVKYIIVPSDIEGKIFLEDRKYSEDKYKEAVNGLSNVKYLNKVKDFGKISVFEISNPKDHFWTNSENLKLKYQYISPVEYKLELKNAKKGDLIIFSEKYDSKWIAKNDVFLIKSRKFNNNFNSFMLPKNGNYILTTYYYPQKFVEIGLIVSMFTILLIIIFIIRSIYSISNKRIKIR